MINILNCVFYSVCKCVFNKPYNILTEFKIYHIQYMVARLCATTSSYLIYTSPLAIALNPETVQTIILTHLDNPGTAVTFICIRHLSRPELHTELHNQLRPHTSHFQRRIPYSALPRPSCYSHQIKISVKRP